MHTKTHIRCIPLFQTSELSESADDLLITGSRLEKCLDWQQAWTASSFLVSESLGFKKKKFADILLIIFAVTFLCYVAEVLNWVLKRNCPNLIPGLILVS